MPRPLPCSEPESDSEDEDERLDPQDMDGNRTGYRWAWLSAAQREQKLQRLAVLKEKLDSLLVDVPGPVYIHGSSLWGRSLQDAKDVDLIAPEARDLPRNLEADIGGKFVPVNIGKELYEVNKVGASLLKKRGEAVCIDYLSTDNCVSADAEDEDEEWLSGMTKAMALLTADPKVDGNIDEYKEQKLRLEALIYIAQRFSDYKELLSDKEDQSLILLLSAEEDDTKEGSLYHAIGVLNTCSLQGSADKTLYSRSFIAAELRGRLYRVFESVIEVL